MKAVKWELLLAMILVLINILNASISPYYLSYSNITSTLAGFLDRGFMVFAMAMIMIMGDIDISVASITALSSVIMGLLLQSGISEYLAILAALIIGILCGFINGIILIKFKEISSAIVTIATMILYRGIAYIILKDQAVNGFPESFSYWGWGSFGEVPFIIILFFIFVIFFLLLLHKTVIGRWTYAIGSNRKASYYAGVPVDKIRLLWFSMSGLMASFSAIFLTSRMSSSRPNVALGYELEVITIVVLGGVSSSGGKGNMFGVILAVFVIALMKNGLGLINMNSQSVFIFTGLLLLIVTLINGVKNKTD